MGQLINTYISSAPPVWTPDDTGVAWAWFESDSYSQSDASAIVTDWQDKSPNNRDAVFTSGGGSFTFETNELNGQPVLRKAAGCSSYFQLPSMAGLTAASIYIVHKVTTGTNGGNLFQGVSSGACHYPYSDGFIYDGFCSNTRKDVLSSQITINGTWHVLKIWSKTSDWGMMQDGSTVHTTGSNTVQMPTGPVLMYNGAQHMNLDLAGVYIFSDKLSGGDDTLVRGRITSLYGV